MTLADSSCSFLRAGPWLCVRSSPFLALADPSRRSPLLALALADLRLISFLALLRSTVCTLPLVAYPLLSHSLSTSCIVSTSDSRPPRAPTGLVRAVARLLRSLALAEEHVRREESELDGEAESATLADLGASLVHDGERIDRCKESSTPLTARGEHERKAEGKASPRGLGRTRRSCA